MTAFLLEVTSNPAVEAKLLDEIQQVVGDGDVRWEDLHRLKYFSCCQKEALRLHPPAPTFVRIAKRAGLLGGKWAIDKGDLVAVPLIALHTNPKACAVQLALPWLHWLHYSNSMKRSGSAQGSAKRTEAIRPCRASGMGCGRCAVQANAMGRRRVGSPPIRIPAICVRCTRLHWQGVLADAAEDWAGMHRNISGKLREASPSMHPAKLSSIRLPNLLRIL